MGTFTENSKRLEFNLREIEYSMGTLEESVSLIYSVFILTTNQLETVDSGKAQTEDLHAFKNSADQTEELMDESEAILKEMEEQHETDRQERLFERFTENFSEYQEKYSGLKPSIDRILSNKQLIRQLE